MTSGKNCILILDPKGNLQSQKIDARNRHKMYGAKLQENDSSGNLELVVFTTGEEEILKSEGEITFKQFATGRLKTPKFIYLAAQEIRKNDLKVLVLVSSDPWESLVVAKLVMLLSRKIMKLQIQVHADISDARWRRANLKNFLRYLFQNFSFRASDQIRVVSEDLNEYIQSKYRIHREKIIVAPVPVLLSSDVLTKKRKTSGDTINIGFIGRMHWDRGVRAFIELIEILNLQGASVTVVVAGQGPQESYLLENLSHLIGRDQLIYLGQLNSSEVQTTILSLDIYSSLAPMESYGLGMREAIGLDVPVIAIKSKGSLEALREFGESKIKLIDYPFKSEQVAQSVQWANTREQGISSAQTIQAQSQKHIDALVNSWIELAND